jgi:hypothetical protein
MKNRLLLDQRALPRSRRVFVLWSGSAILGDLLGFGTHRKVPQN